MSSQPVEIHLHDPQWIDRYLAIAGRIRAALDDAAVRIEHIGSTAVPGLAAKPVIDVQVSVADVSDLDAYRTGLEFIGMLHRPHPEVVDRREFFRPTGPRTVHVHVVDAGGEVERRHLLHRDFLRADGHAAAEYAARKRTLAAAYGNDRQRYQDAKGPFIATMGAAAEMWAKRTGWSP